MATLIPTEEEEQIAFVQWLEVKGYPHHHSPLEGSGGRQAAIHGRKMKILGASKGFPDLLVMIPISDDKDAENAVYEAVAIEMKRQRGGVVSKEQKEWLQILESAGIRGRVCHGCNEAIKFIREVEKEIKGE